MGPVSTVSRTALVSAALGTALGLAEAVRLAMAGSGGAWLAPVVWYGTLWLGLGILSGLGVSLVARERGTASFLVPALGTGMFVIGATANVACLPSSLSPVSLVVDAVLLGAAAIGYLLLRRRGVTGPRGRLFGAVLTVSVLTALVSDGLRGGAETEAPYVTRSDGNHPCVLLVVVDTLRADHLSLYGYERETSPNLDALARGGLVYTAARATSSWTKPSVGSILSGLTPGMHGADGRSEALPAAAETVAEDLSAGGYETGIFSDNLFVSSRFGLDQGFAHVTDVAGGAFTARWRLPAASLLGHVYIELVGDALPMSLPVPSRRIGRYGAEGLNRRFLEWIDGLETGRRWFAYVHYMEPHDPYEPPSPFLEMFPRAAEGGGKLHDRVGQRGHAPFVEGDTVSPEQRQAYVDAYDGEIAWWDDCFGRLLRSLEERDIPGGLAIVLTADHGESFYDHGTWSHGNSLHREQLHVPLVIRAEGVTPGSTDRAVSLDGVPEAILELAGLVRERPPALPRARSLLGAGGGEVMAKLIFRNAVQRALVLDGVKWILSERGGESVLECYDVAGDPREERDLGGARAEAAAAARGLFQRAARLEERMGLKAGRVGMDGALDDALQGLGYMK